MERYHFFTVLLCGVFISRAFSLPSTNFSIDCESMMPDHSTEPQKSEPPYRISVSSEEYDPESELKVSIEGTSGFKWFMLQARDIDENTPVGSFKITDPKTQAFDCYNMSNSALIHTDSEEKNNITSLWVSPADKKVQFLATIFKDPETYWLVIPNTAIFPKGFNETSEESEAGDKSKEGKVAPKGRKKSAFTVRINCGQGGAGSYASSSECAKGSTFSSQSISGQSQGGIVYQGGIKKGGCIGGGTASVYNKYGCTDPGLNYGGSNSYGQSVSTVSDKGKVIVYAPSKPYPPERITYSSQLANSKYKHIQNTQYGEKIQGSGPQSGVRITIQSGQPGLVCDKTSSSYNSEACKLVNTLPQLKLYLYSLE